MKKLTLAIATASAMTAGLMGATAAHAEVSASASVASQYLWRGQNLGNGDPAVSGSLDYAHESGAYVGAWVSSGDAALGTEYDVYFGFSGEAGALSYDIGYASYIYPSQSEEAAEEFNTANAAAILAGDADAQGVSDEFGDVGELYLGLGFAGVDFMTYYNDKGGDYVYQTLGYGMGDFSGLVGVHSSLEDEDKTHYTHIDLSYAYNDAVSFTVSKMVATDGDASSSPEFVVSYTLPIE